MIDDHGPRNRDHKGVTLTLWPKTGLHPGSVSEVGRRGDGDGGQATEQPAHECTDDLRGAFQGKPKARAFGTEREV